MSQSITHESAWLVSAADIDFDDQGVPHALAFADVYYSSNNKSSSNNEDSTNNGDATDDGLAETRHVFLQHNDLQQRWRALDERAPGFVIIETGFGTGLNFLAAAQLWQDTAPAHCRLHFISVEKFPLTPADLQRALASRTQFAALAAELLGQYPPLLRGHHVLTLANGRITLQLIFDDAIAALTQLLDSDYPAWPQPATRCADAFFLDGFAPAKNPDMWSTELFQSMARLCKPGTSFATFTSAGEVKRGLAAAGFEVRKVRGCGRKRDMLCGIWPARDSAQCYVPSPRSRQKFLPLWAVTESTPIDVDRSVLIIGAGLAGAHTAYALAQRGWQVTVIDAATAIASGASGNAQGVLYTKLSARPDNVSRFAVASYVHALRTWQRLHHSKALPAEAASFCGVLYAGYDAETAALHAAVANAFAQSPDSTQSPTITQWVDATNASHIAGIELTQPALWMPAAGYLVPHLVCRALLDHPQIHLKLSTQATQIERDGNAWHVITATGEVLRANTVVICNANDARQLQQTAYLPLKPVRGQTTQLPVTDTSRRLNCVICHDGYLPPARDNQHCIGATFDTQRLDVDVDANDHTDNLQRLAMNIPALADSIKAFEPSTLQGRAALRCTTPDYLPIVGPVTDVPQTLQRFAALASNAQTQVSCPGAVLPGLYVNVGHGSRGLSSTPIAAALLAAYIEQTPYPMAAELRLHLHPTRFVIRDLIRKRRVTYT